jgi:predicted lipoprotein
MAASESVGRASARPQPVATPLGGLKSVLLIAAVVAIALYFFPLFRIVSLKTHPAAAATAAAAAPAAFDPVSSAAKIWKADLPVAIPRAVELKALAPAIRANADTAKTRYAKAAGLGTAYYFVRGSGKVVSRDRNTLRLSLDGAESEIIALRVGPVFGNTVRDGCGLLDVNTFPGLQEFNDLSGALNTLVEQNVLPLLREKAVVGATVHFAGCAEAPESAAEPGEPLLTLVPIQAEVRG